MTKDSDEKRLYPVASLHDFLFELDKEWGKFRNGSLIGLVASGTLFMLIVLLLFGFRRFDLGLIEIGLLLVVGIFLAYSIYAMYSQYRFFNRWERRVGLLRHLEDELMQEKLGENKS